MSLTNRLADEHSVYAKIGDFWYRGLTADSTNLMRNLVELWRVSKCPAQFQQAQDWLSGKLPITEEQLTLRFDPRQVGYAGADFQQRLVAAYNLTPGSPLNFVIARPDTYDSGMAGLLELTDQNGQYLSAEDGQFIFIPAPPGAVVISPVISLDSLEPRYLIPIPGNLIPTAITNTGRELLLGVDFFMGLGCLIFAQDPGALFPSQAIMVKCARLTKTSAFSYTQQVDRVFGDCSQISKYMRESMTANQFMLATAQAAGLPILPWNSTLLEVRPLTRGYQYLFEDGVINAPYPHTPLVAFTPYPKNLIPGNVLQVHSAASGGPTWYRQLSWVNGLPFDDLCPFKGIIAPDQPCRVSAVSQDAGGYHVQIALQGNAAALSSFWSYVYQNEMRTGVYLNAAFGITSLTEVLYTNPIDFYFEMLLGASAVIFTIARSAIGEDAWSRAHDFIQREKPVGSLPIIIQS